METKGKTLEEIDALFEGEKHSSVPDIERIRNGDKQIDTTIIEEQLIAELDPTRAKVSGSEIVA